MLRNQPKEHGITTATAKFIPNPKIKISRMPSADSTSGTASELDKDSLFFGKGISLGGCWLLLALLLCLSMLARPSFAIVDMYEFDSPQQEAQYRGLIEELRCPKCQNQNLASSDAPIAQDLKQRTYEMVIDGRSDAEIRQYMFDRYGDFISYKPPVRPSTWILWFFPPLLLVLMVVGWLWRTKRRNLLLSAYGAVSPDAAKLDKVALTPQEQADLDRLLTQHQSSHSHSTDDANADAHKGA